MKTRELIGPALDWAVAKCEGLNVDVLKNAASWYKLFNVSHSTELLQGYPIIEREKIEVLRGNDLYFPQGNERGEYYESLWLARIPGTSTYHGPTPLIAAMRCYVASKMGNEIEIPEELK